MLFLKVVNELETLVFNNKPINDVIVNSEDVMNHFEQIFPEVAKSNDTGKLTKEAFSLWENNKNNICIELDTSPLIMSQPKFDVYIGGPASAVAAALHAKSGEFTFKVKIFLRTVSSIDLPFPHTYKALPLIIPAFLIMPAPGAFLCRGNLVASNNTRN